MKRVAFFSFDWNYEFMAEYYEGMRAFVESRDDVQLVIFNAFGQYANYEPEAGTFELFTLCKLEDYDGFVIQGNRNWPPAMRQRLADEVQALGKPIVSINYELQGAYCVGTDNYKAMYELVDKVLNEKGRLRPAFVNGLATSWEARSRLQAFEDACTAHGIEDVRVYQANWEMEEGVKAARAMLEHPDDLPDVIFCCNDDLAVGVQRTLQEHGVKVPDDLMITGFDNRDITLKAQPRITTIDRDYRGVGQLAIESLVRILEGEQLPRSIASGTKFVLTESCGYESTPDSRVDVISSLYTIDNALKSFYEVLTRLQPVLLSADSISGILCECERYFPEIRCPRVFLTINDSYLSNDTSRVVTTYGTISQLMAQSGTSIPMTSYEHHVYASHLTRELLPPDVPMDAPLYMVFPLRHNTTCIGTLVTEGLSPILRYGFLTIVLTLLSGSIESVRKKELLTAANARLDDLYVHDQLTGLFNRFGLERIGTIAYEHLLRDFDEAQFIFVDIDFMKSINDEYGHEVGDLALRDTADIINRAIKDENAFAMRYGGDEFLLISRRNLIPKLECELEMMRTTIRRPYELSLSMGCYRVMRDDHLTVREAIEQADARMYDIKKARRRGR